MHRGSGQPGAWHRPVCRLIRLRRALQEPIEPALDGALTRFGALTRQFILRHEHVERHPLPPAWRRGGIGGGVKLISHRSYVSASANAHSRVSAPSARSQENLTRLAAALMNAKAVDAEAGDFGQAERPMSATRVEDLSQGNNFRLVTDLGDLDVFQWARGIEADDLYAELDQEALSGSVEGVAVRLPQHEPHALAVRLRRSGGGLQDRQGQLSAARGSARAPQLEPTPGHRSS
jgi:hypothetical protein